MNTGGVEPRVARYSERPELWDAVAGLSDEVWLDAALTGAFHLQTAGGRPTAVCAVAAKIPPRHQRRGLAKVIRIDRDNDAGEYWEPNIWIIHQVSDC